MRILITGSEGNVGSRLVPYLLERGHEVFRVDQVQGYAPDYQVVNILSPIDLIEAFDYFEPDAVFHLAAMVSRVTSEQSPGLTVDTNIGGLNNVIQACKAHDAKLIYFSTSEVYGNIGGVLSEDRVCKPNNLYGLTKYLGEKLVEYELTNGLRAVTVRPFMFYDEYETRGVHRSAMIRFCDSLTRREKITVHKDAKRSWMHMEDAVRVIERTLYIKDYEVMNVGSGEIFSISHLASMICSKIGIDYSEYVIELPLPVKMTLEKYPDIRKQVNLTGVIPSIDLPDGIDRVLSRC